MTTKFRSITRRSGIIFSPPTPGAVPVEFSPFWDYDAPTSLPWLHAAYSALTDPAPQVLRREIPVNVTIPAVGPDRAQQIVAASSGCQTAKVKVGEPGQQLSDDLDRVAAVRAALGPGGHVRIDVNGGWQVREAVDAITRLDKAAGGLEYAEQPVASVEDLARVRRAVDVPIAADESIRRAEDPYRVKQLEAADIVVLKVQPLGGVQSCLRLATEIELPVVVSSALESSVGLYQGLLLAAALPQLPHACGLATMQLLTGDTTSSPYRVRDGHITLEPPQLSPDNAGVQADSALQERWRQRVSEVSELDPILAETFAAKLGEL